MEFIVAEETTDIVIEGRWFGSPRLKLAKEEFADQIFPLKLQNGYIVENRRLSKLTAGFHLFSRTSMTGRMMLGYGDPLIFGISYARTHLSRPNHSSPGSDLALSMAMSGAVTKNSGTYSELSLGVSQRYYHDLLEEKQKIQFYFWDYLLGYEYQIFSNIRLSLGASFRLSFISPEDRKEAGHHKDHNDLRNIVSAFGGIVFLL